MAVVAEREGVVLRHARPEDLPAIDTLTVEGYRPIQQCYVSMLGADCYETVRHQPELTWEERKIRQNRDLYEQHPDWVWVLVRDGNVFGYVTFWLVAEQGYGHLDKIGKSEDALAKA